MIKLIISDDNDNTKFYNLKDYEIKKNNDELILKLITDEQTITYGIRADFREKDLESIMDYISQILQDDDSTNKQIKISEYLQRMYIYIGDGENDRQFTADRRS